MSTLQVNNLITTDSSFTIPVKDILTEESPLFDTSVVPGNIVKLGNTSGIATMTVPDNQSQRLLITKDVSHPDDFSVLQINRNANYEGGTSGYVGSALVVRTTANSPTTTNTFEWAGLFILDNYVAKNPGGGGPGSGAVPQQVALYGQANKNSTSATWAGCFEINDNYYDGTVANGQSVGIEITVRGVGADSATPSRVGMHVAAHVPTGATAMEWGTAYYATSDAGANVRFRYVLKTEGIIGDSLIHNSATTNQASAALIRDVGSLTLGIDLSGATYGSGTAIRIAQGAKLSFDSADTNHIFSSAQGLVTNSVFNLKSSIALPSVNGSINNTSTSASAGTASGLPAAPSGYWNITIDGVTKRVPYYN